jgi:diguanylate cyclase (GGDEF)-like protein
MGHQGRAASRARNGDSAGVPHGFACASRSKPVNLKPRFLILTTLLILVASAAAWLAFERIAEGIVEQWGMRLAQTQVRYDTSRLLRPLAREIALARQMASSPLLRKWAEDPDDPGLAREAVVEMESFRANFQDGNYFVALRATGAYYFNNAANEFDGRLLRAHLSQERPADRWFFESMAQGREFRLDVNSDRMGVARLWIDVPVRDGDRVLGVVGTGLKLDTFIRDVVDAAQPGVRTLFVDAGGAIQLYRDPQLLNLDSAPRVESARKTLDQLLDATSDQAALHKLMATVKAVPGTVATRVVHVGGQRNLAGVAYLSELGWFEITLLDLDALIPLHGFASLGTIFALALLVSLGVFNLVLNGMVLRPLAALEAAMRKVQQGDFGATALPRQDGEIGRLMTHFTRMADAIRSHTQHLEDKVQARTEALHLLARIDALTELYNRRGMSELIEHEIDRATRHGDSPGLLWLDIDFFKQVNDRFGHAEGDRILTGVAALLRANIRPYDNAGRWGGDEFLVLVPESTPDSLATTGERIRSAIAQQLALPSGEAVTASIGAYLASPGESLDVILYKADQALYAAKNAGRNCMRCHGDASTIALPGQ